MTWANAYLGIPWRAHGASRDGADCWGLVRLVYRERLGLELPNYSASYVTAEERCEIQATIAGERGAGAWREVDAERAFDVALFRIMGHVSHVAIVVGDGLALHAERGADSGLIRYREGRWASRLCGFQRHKEAAAS